MAAIYQDLNKTRVVMFVANQEPSLETLDVTIYKILGKAFQDQSSYWYIEEADNLVTIGFTHI